MCPFGGVDFCEFDTLPWKSIRQVGHFTKATCSIYTRDIPDTCEMFMDLFSLSKSSKHPLKKYLENRTLED